MANTQRTYLDLLTQLFQDNQAPSSITAQDLRDLIVSVGTGNQELLTPAVYNEYLTAGVALEPGSSHAPSITTFRDGIKAKAFTGSGGNYNEAFFQIHIHHDYKKETDITFHIHWSHNNLAPSGDVKWNIEYSIAKGYQVSAYPGSTTLSTIQTAGAQYLHHITDDDDMVIPGSNSELEPDAIIIGRIFRNPNSVDSQDTFADNAFLLHVDVHYQVGRLGGTVERNRPWTAEGF